MAWNVFERAAQSYGEQPVWLYSAFGCGILILVPPFLRSGFRALVEGGRQLPVVLVASVFYVFMHNLVVRKSFRFVISALILLLVVYASALLFRKATESRLRTVHRRVFVVAHVVALVLSSFWYPHQGPVEAALALSRQEDFKGRLVVVDGTNDDVGGHYYLQRSELEVQGVERRSLAQWICREHPNAPLYLMVVRRPLKSTTVPEGYVLDELGYFSDWPDLKRNTRRFLYRLRKETL